MTDFDFMNVGQWTNNTFDQQLIIDQIKLALHSAKEKVLANAHYFVYLEQPAEPSQSEWEDAYEAQTQRTVPIIPSATLVWMNTNIDDVGGIYGTTPVSAGAVVRRESRYPLGGALPVERATLSSTVSTNVAIGVNNSNHPSVTLDLPVRADVLLTYSLYVHLSSGTGTWGADFLWNGVKLGTRDQGIPTIAGLTNHAASGQLTVTHFVPEVAPGSYTIQAIMGVTGAPASPPTLAYGGSGSGAGNYGQRVLTVRAFAR